MREKILFYQGAINKSGAIKSTLKIASGLKEVLKKDVLIATGVVDQDVYKEM